MDQRNALRSSAGFTLVEIMVTVTILSLLMLAAVPAYQKIQRKARTAAIVSDLQVFAAAFQAHAHESGWPPECPAGVVPAGMTGDELKADVWLRPTPIGGNFDWENDQLYSGVHYRAAIAITETTAAPMLVDLDQLLDIDRTIDDGDLTTGNFRQGFGNGALFIIEN